MRAEITPAVTLNAPELFADPAFQAWLNDPTVYAATWHAKGTPPTEYSDVFLTYDHGEGSEVLSMPQHCWEAIRERVEWLGPGWAYCLVRLTNQEE